jgi:chemotaxis protein methyltransferase CheR
VLPELVAARAETKRLRVWSAACAAGQEAYSLGILLDELKLVQKGWSIDLVATDLSSDLIARAEEGVFTDFELQPGLSQARLSKYFTREGESWRVRDSLKRLVTFRAFNLLDSYGWLYPLDLVLCRNVLLYFEQRARVQVVEKIAEIIAPDGVLLVGHTESIAGLSLSFSRLDGLAGFYRIGDRGTVLRYRPRAVRA